MTLYKVGRAGTPSPLSPLSDRLKRNTWCHMLWNHNGQFEKMGFLSCQTTVSDALQITSSHCCNFLLNTVQLFHLVANLWSELALRQLALHIQQRERMWASTWHTYTHPSRPTAKALSPHHHELTPSSPPSWHKPARSSLAGPAAPWRSCHAQSPGSGQSHPSPAPGPGRSWCHQCRPQLLWCPGGGKEVRDQTFKWGSNMVESSVGSLWTPKLISKIWWRRSHVFSLGHHQCTMYFLLWEYMHTFTSGVSILISISGLWVERSSCSEALSWFT